MSSIVKNIVPPVVWKTATGDYNYRHDAAPDMTGKTAVITGGTNGIGLSLARTLWTRNANLILLSTTKETADKAIAYIKSGDLSKAPGDYAAGFTPLNPLATAKEADRGATGGQGSVEWKKVSLEDLKEVRTVGEEINKSLERKGGLDLIYAIAGIGVNAFEATNEGYDKHLVINNLSHHLLISSLSPALMSAPSPRVIIMSSELHRATLGGPSKMLGGEAFATKEEFKRDIGPSNLYARTKLAAILEAKGIAQKTELGKKAKIFATHPGAVATGQQDQFKPAYGETLGGVMAKVVRPSMRTPDEGSLSVLWCGVSEDAMDPKWENATYFTDPAELGKESAEASSQPLIDNYWRLASDIVKEVAGVEVKFSSKQ